MKIWFLAMALVVSSVSAGKITVLKSHLTSAPASLKLKGKVVDGVRWKDDKGEFLVLVTETGETPSAKGKCEENEGDCRDAEIHAYGYSVLKDSFSLVWQVNDQERNCMFDLFAGLSDSGLFVTDVDGNGEAECTMIYQLTCRSDISPDALKLIMYQGTKKTAIRGTTYPKGIGACDDCGKMTVDKSFSDVDKRILDFATKKFQLFTHRENHRE